MGRGSAAVNSEVKAANDRSKEPETQSPALTKVHNGRMITIDNDDSSSRSSSSKDEEDLAVILDFSTLVPSYLPSPQILFNRMFEYKPSMQNISTVSLLGLKGRATTGDSKHNKRRKIAENNARGIEASKSMSEICQFKCGVLKTTGVPLPAMENKIQAVSIPLEMEATKINQDLLNLKKWLKLKTIQKSEDFKGQWRARHKLVFHYLNYQKKNPDHPSWMAAKVTTSTARKGGWVTRKIPYWAKQ
ncbi:hypothetical protein RUND412_002361 [Rhizina undulata]